MSAAVEVLLLLSLFAQEDVAKQIERLKSDSIDDRETAVHVLEELGTRALPALEKEAAATQDLETKIRIQALLRSIPRRAALLKVFGPTKRVTYSAKATSLKDVIQELGKSLDESIRVDGADPSTPVTLELRDTPMWQALDAVAAAAKASYEYRKDGVVFLKGAAPWFPVRYSEQFRISIVEAKRIEYRRPGVSASIVMLVPELQFQRNVNPADKFSGGLSSLFQIEEISDGRGHDLRTDTPWGPGSLSSRRPFGIQQYFYAKADSKTITIQGVAKARFSRRDDELVLPIAGDSRSGKLGDASFTLDGFTPGATRSTVTLKGELPETSNAPDPPLRVKKVWLVSPSGERVEGRGDRGTHSMTSFTQTYEFPPLKFQPEKFAFLWVSEIHSLEIPFRLEGVPVPQP